MPKKYASVLDYPRPGLDGAVWSPDATLLPQHKDKIVESVMSHLLSAGFQSPQYWIDDIYLVGSLTTYQYLPTTDVDVHVSVNLKNFIEHETPVLSDQEAHDLLDALRKKFNPEKATLDGTKHPLELYFETPVAFKGRSDRTGVYSVMTDEWLVPPVSVDADFDIETMNPYFIDLAEQLAGEFDLGLGKLNRDVNRAQELSEVIQTWSPEQRTKFEEKLQQRLLKIEQEIQDLILKKDQITKERQNYSPESEQEIKFKYVQRFGYFAIISALKELVKDDGKVTEDELPEIEKILDKKAADSKYTHGYCAEYAVALSEKLGKPLGVIRGHFADDEDVEDAYQDAHAFVFISDTVGMDAKGERPIQDMINETAWVEKPTEIDAVKADLANLEFSFGTIDRDIVEEAKATIGKTAALKPKVVQVETFTIGGGTVKVVVAQDALDHYLNSIKNFYNNPNLMDADDARRAAHETALESALSLTDFHGEDPYLYASNVRDALSNFAEEMFNKKYGTIKVTADFSPTIATPPPTNEWQSDSNVVIPTDVDPISDEETLNNPIVDKPRKGIWRSLIDWFIKRRDDKEALKKEARSDHAAWIDPKGKAYVVRSEGEGGTHRGWIENSADLLRKEYGYEIPHEQGWMSDTVALRTFDSMLKDGWIRVGDSLVSNNYISFQVPNMRNIPSYVDDYLATFYEDGMKIEVEEGGDYRNPGKAVALESPFPTLQKAVNKALVSSLPLAANKEAAFELQYWLDPNGQEYEGDALKDENVQPEKLIHSGWVQVLMPSDRQGIVLVVDELEFTPDHVNNFLAKTVGHGDPVTVKDTKGSTVTLRYPFKNIRGLIKKYLYAPEQEKAAALGSQSIWISPDGKEHQATYSHADWAFDNADFLSKNYGINLVVPETLDDLDDMEVARYHSDILNTLIEAGWVRVFIYGSQINFQISDMEHPPKSAEAFFDNHAHAFDRVVVEDYASAESVELIKPDLGLARGIAHALRTQNQLAASSTKIPVEAFLKQASSGRYWIDPNGKEYNVPGTHTAWVGRNAEKLNKNFGYDLPLGVKHGHEYTNMLIDNGWVRIGHSNFGTEQFVVDVKDINNIPSTVDNFIAEHFNPNYKAPILVGSGIGKAVTVNDPFPSIQEAVNTELKFSKHSYLKKRGEHDYDPSWDYEVNTKVKPKIKSLVNAIISNWGELLKTLDLAKPSVHFVNNLGEGTIAMYVNGTYTAPVLLLDIDATVEAVKGYDISLETAIETSLLHELGHAWQDSVDYEYDEDEAEHFAQEYYNTGGISLPIEEAQKSLAEDPTRHDPSISASLLTASASSDIMKLIQETGGASYNLQSGNLAGTEMYAVSTHPERSVTLDHIPTEEEIDSYLNQNKDILSGENSFGAWFNKDNGKTYLDIVTTLPDRDKAIELGKKHNQIAIFDLKNFVEIPTGGTGEVVSKQAKSIEEVRGIKVLVNPTENEIRSFWKRSREKSLRALIDPATGDTFVWDAYLSEHNSIIRYFDLNIDWESDDGTYIRHVAHDVDISSLLQQQAETKQNPNIPVESGFYGPEDGHPKEYYTHNTDDKNLGNPNQRFMGRPKGPNRSNQEEVIKMIFEQDIDKKAFTINGFWVAPDGKSFDVRSSGSKTHGDWVMKNAKILQKYGIKDAAKRDYFEVAAEMLQKGWARVGDSQRNKFAAVGVEVNNIKSIPSGVDNVLATFLQDGDVVVVADLNGDWGEVTYPFKSLQSAINKARMGRRGSAYTQQQMEEIYVEQHDMHDDPGGGGGWTPNNYNNSSTDFPSPKDMQPVQVFLDKLDKTKTPPIPSYEVSWAISTPKE